MEDIIKKIYLRNINNINNYGLYYSLYRADVALPDFILISNITSSNRIFYINNKILYNYNTGSKMWFVWS